MIAPMKPTPTTTTSTDLSFCAIFLCTPYLHRVVKRTASYADGFAIELYPVLINQLVVVPVRPRKSHHLPADHLFVAAINRIGEETFDCVLQQKVGEHFRRH